VKTELHVWANYPFNMHLLKSNMFLFCVHFVYEEELHNTCLFTFGMADHEDNYVLVAYI